METSQGGHPGDYTPVIRAYRHDDAAATLTVFTQAITVTAAHDYAPDQVAAWARAGERDLRTWDEELAARGTVVAVVNLRVVGFADVDADGYVDKLFVAPAYGRRGIAGALLAFLEARARDLGANRMSADVSITARRFFESNGFTVDAEQHPERAGVRLTNFAMSKSLPQRYGAVRLGKGEIPSASHFRGAT